MANQQQISGLIHAMLLDGKGGVNTASLEELKKLPKEQPIWLHFDFRDHGTKTYLRRELGLSITTIEALTAEDTRPRSEETADGWFLNLRGINVNPGEEPDDMVSIRMLIQDHRLISCRRRQLSTTEELLNKFQDGVGPKNLEQIITFFTAGLTDGMDKVMADLDQRVDEIEEQLLEKQDINLGSEVAEIRRELIQYRRYFGPQREALFNLYNASSDGLSYGTKAVIREKKDALQRLIEEIDSLKERLSVIRDEINNQQLEQATVRIFLLSLLAGIFVPLTFLSGLLGANVGGIPLAESEWGFLIVCLAMLAVAVGMLGYFKFKRWF